MHPSTYNHTRISSRATLRPDQAESTSGRTIGLGIGLTCGIIILSWVALHLYIQYYKRKDAKAAKKRTRDVELAPMTETNDEGVTVVGDEIKKPDAVLKVGRD